GGTKLEVCQTFAEESRTPSRIATRIRVGIIIFGAESRRPILLYTAPEMLGNTAIKSTQPLNGVPLCHAIVEAEVKLDRVTAISCLYLSYFILAKMSKLPGKGKGLTSEPC